MVGWNRLWLAGAAAAAVFVVAGLGGPALVAQTQSGQARTAPAAAAPATARLAAAALATAGPATTVRYPTWASATQYSGPAFDTCTAPPLATMQAWGASPYRAIGVYVGGIDRTCAQPELTRTWAAAVTQLGWRLLPIYKGLQAPCGDADNKIIASAAASEGKAAADDASASVKALGMIKGSALYYDMEGYPTTSSACRTAVLTFLSAWTSELHQLGYVAGVYESLNFGARDLASVYNSSSYARPDALWIARYDHNPSLTGWAGIPDSLWAVHQRAKQYDADFSATYGGASLVIDADSVDAPVATFAFGYTVSTSGPVRARSGPGTSYRVVKTYPGGAAVTVVCQAHGTTVGGSPVWDKLTDSTYLPDRYVSTPSDTGYSAPLTHCQYPYQVTPSGGANERAGPSSSQSATGRLPGGGLAWVVCQQAGSAVGRTRIWDKISYRHWVSDNYVATPSATGYSSPIPRC